MSAITTRTAGAVGIHTHIHVEHVTDTTPGDEYEAVCLTLGDTMVDLHPQDAQALHKALGAVLTGEETPRRAA